MSLPRDSISDKEEEEERSVASPGGEVPLAAMERILELMTALTDRQREVEDRQREVEDRQREADDRRRESEDRQADLLSRLMDRQREREDRQADLLSRLMDRLESIEIVVQGQPGDPTAETTTHTQFVAELGPVYSTGRPHSETPPTSSRLEPERGSTADRPCPSLARREATAGATERQLGTVGFEPESSGLQEPQCGLKPHSQARNLLSYPPYNDVRGWN